MTDLPVIRRALYSLLSAMLCLVPATGKTTESLDVIGVLDCVINPSVVADLGSSAPGILASVAVDRSDFVTAGDAIAELESGVESASVNLAKTRADSTAEVDLRRVNAAYGHRLRKRTKDLFQRNVVSTNDLDERETEARLARIQLRQALDNQSIAKVELARAEEILKRRTIKSPFTGVVMERFKVVGEYVEDQPIARVAQLDPLHVEVIVPVDHLGKVTPGMTAEVWTEVVEDQRWVAEVTRVDKVADVASGTYGVRLSLPNPDYRIPAGLRCQMQLVESAPQPVAAKGLRNRPDERRVADLEVPRPEALTLPEPRPSPAVETASVEVEEAPVAAAEVVSTEAVDKPPTETAFHGQADDVASEVGATPDAVANGSVTAEASIAEALEKEVPVVPIEVAAKEPRVPPVALPTSSGPPVPEPVAEVIEPVQPVIERLAPEPVVEAPESGPTASEQPPACRVAGPFRDEVVATRKVVKLRRAGLTVDIKSIAKGRHVELKIMTPVLENHAAAEEVIAKMKKAGLSDHYLHKMPAGKRRVYLGIYNSKRFADKRLRELSDAGIKAFSRPSKNSGLDYFLVIRGVPDADVQQMVSRLPFTQDDEAEKLGFCDKFAGN